MARATAGPYEVFLAVYTVNNPPNWYIFQGTGEGSNRSEFAKSGV